MVTDSPSAPFAIEFWSTIAETEKDLEESDFDEEITSPQFAKKILSSLVPRLCSNLLKQVDCTDDEDDWNIASASAACIVILSKCTGGAILEHILPFIQHIRADNWRQRDASTMAFGSIMHDIYDDDSNNEIAEVVGQVLPVVMEHLNSDENDCVRSTSAWAISHVAANFPEVVQRDTTGVLRSLVNGLANEDSIIAYYSCFVC